MLRIFRLPLFLEVNNNSGQGQQGYQEQSGKDGSAGIAAQCPESFNSPKTDFGFWQSRWSLYRTHCKNCKKRKKM